MPEDWPAPGDPNSSSPRSDVPPPPSDPRWPDRPLTLSGHEPMRPVITAAKVGAQLTQRGLRPVEMFVGAQAAEAGRFAILCRPTDASDTNCDVMALVENDNLLAVWPQPSTSDEPDGRSVNIWPVSPVLLAGRMALLIRCASQPYGWVWELSTADLADPQPAMRPQWTMPRRISNLDVDPTARLARCQVDLPWSNRDAVLVISGCNPRVALCERHNEVAATWPTITEMAASFADNDSPAPNEMLLAECVPPDLQDWIWRRP